MQVFINGKPTPIAQGATLADLLAQFALDPKACATAVNGTFVARDARAAIALKDNDQVMTFEPITGG